MNCILGFTLQNYPTAHEFHDDNDVYMRKRQAVKRHTKWSYTTIIRDSLCLINKSFLRRIEDRFLLLSFERYPLFSSKILVFYSTLIVESSIGFK